MIPGLVFVVVVVCATVHFVVYRKRLRRGSRRPLNGVRHAETVTWLLHVVIVLDYFSGFWRWVSLGRSGQLWAAAVCQRF